MLRITYTITGRLDHIMPSLTDIHPSVLEHWKVDITMARANPKILNMANSEAVAKALNFEKSK
jgi:hypothetical protein